MIILQMIAVVMYLITCIGFYKNVTSEPEVLESMLKVPSPLSKLILVIASLLWPCVIFVSLYIKGLIK